MAEASHVPVQLMELLQPWACLLAADPATHLEDFMAAAAEEGREASLEELGDEVVRLRAEAQEVMDSCCDDVRTGRQMGRWAGCCASVPACNYAGMVASRGCHRSACS
jgi:hypothetical protein